MFLVGTWIWLWRITDILLKGLLSDSDPRMLLLQWGLSSLGFCSVSSDNFFVFRYAYLSLVLAIDFWNSQLIVFLYISYLKKSQRGGPTFKLWRGSGVLLLNFEGGPEVPPLSFRGVPGPTFKLWGGSRFPESWSHFFTMPM